MTALQPQRDSSCPILTVRRRMRPHAEWREQHHEGVRQSESHVFPTPPETYHAGVPPLKAALYMDYRDRPTVFSAIHRPAHVLLRRACEGPSTPEFDRLRGQPDSPPDPAAPRHWALSLR